MTAKPPHTAPLIPSPLSVAPMMDWTDRHCRYFHRLISRRTVLYTEMVTTGAVIHGDRERLLGFSPQEHPVVLQLGGSDPQDLAQAARIGAEWGYDEINLNCGCPSDRVQSGAFGACLMAEPERVADCIGAMQAAVAIPVTVKCRLAIDEMEEWPTLLRFVETVAAAGCRRFVVHARKAWLKGLSPKENRDIPPLRYELVHRLKQERPDLDIALNGGVRSLKAAVEQMSDPLGTGIRLDGVMIGRAVYETPYLLAGADRLCFGDSAAPPPTPHQVVDAMLPYIEDRLSQGTPLNAITRHMLGLFHGLPGARAWRRHLSENAHRPDRASPELVRAAAAFVSQEQAESALLSPSTAAE